MCPQLHCGYISVDERETYRNDERIAVAVAMRRSATSLCALMKSNLNSDIYRIIRFEFNIENVISLKSHVFQSLMQEIHP